MKDDKLEQESVILIDIIQKAVKKLNDKEAEQSKEFIGDIELRERLGISRTTLYNWRKDGIIPYKRIGNKLFYPWKAIKKIMGDL